VTAGSFQVLSPRTDCASSQAQAITTLDEAIAQGINLVDTAPHM